MKLILLMMLVATFNATAIVYSQYAKVTIHVKNGTLEDVFKEIESKSDFNIFYKVGQIDLFQKVTVEGTDLMISDVLEQVLANTGATYTVLDKTIVIKYAGKVGIQPSKKVTGIVKDQNSGEPLIGVSISIQGTTQGVITDAEGKYSIEAPSDSSVLVFTYIGYQKQEIQVGANTAINLGLVSNVQKLDEVVIVGYGVLKRSSITGAISVISSKEITQLPVASVESALQGQAAGVSVVNNGSPGTVPIVRIRGNGSINLSAAPLYVVDGLPTINISGFDSKDIESVEVLKDASSASIYGSRAANGVVLITTKKAKRDGKTHMSFDTYTGVQSIAKKLDLLSTTQYRDYAKAFGALPINLQDSAFNSPIYAGASTTYAQTNTDWQNAIFRSAPINQSNFSFSSNSDNSSFFGSSGYYKQDGILIGTSYQRLNFRFNSEHKLTKRITVGQTAFYSNGMKYNEKETQGRTVVMHTIRSLPYLPVMDPTKLGNYRGATGADKADVDNPVKIENLYQSTTATDKLFGTVYAELEITDFLKFRSTAGLDYENILNYLYFPIYNDGFNSNQSATVSKETFSNTTKLFSNQLTFDKKWDEHNINLIAVQEEQPFNMYTTYINGSLPTNTVADLSGLSGVTANGRKELNTLLSYVGRLNYDFKNKYILSAAIRYDGSSKFATGKKWGTFPSVSLGWRLSEEEFMKSIYAISELKLRGGYGIVGFNGIGNYDPQAIISMNSQYVLNGGLADGSYYSGLANKNLTWETSKMTNIGIDLALFKNKISFSAEYFNKMTDDLILNVTPAYSMGIYTPVTTNIGQMKNYGMEFELGYHVRTGDFKSNITGNLSIIRNEVLKLNTPTATIDAGQNPDFDAYDMTRTVVGQPIQSFYGWQTDGIFQNEAEIAAGPKQVSRKFNKNPVSGKVVPDSSSGTSPGDIRYKDISGPNGVPDGKIDGYDRKFLGSYMPKFSYGLNYEAYYKSFDLSLFFQGVYGNKIYNGTKVLTHCMLRLFGAGTEVLNAWTPTNTTTDVPRVIGGDPNQNTRTSDRFIESGTYLRLKALTVGYTLPTGLMNSVFKNNAVGLRVYVSGQNLLTFTKYTGYDPEIGSRIQLSNGAPGAANLLTNGIDYGFMPAARSFMGGLQISF